MVKRIELSNDKLDFIKEQYPKLDLTLSEMAEHLGVSVETIRRRAKELKLERPKCRIYGDNLEWLKLNYNKTYAEMEEYLGVDSETIRTTLKALELTRTSKYRPFKIDPNDTEFWADIDNPRLTAPDIVEKYSEKYGIGESAIWAWRRKKQIKIQVNTLERESRAEKEVKLILDKLDIAYIKEKHIGKYHIDFYLGFKACIEVQGRYWHSKPKRIESDKRKKDYLESQGYKILYLWEDSKSHREDILKFITELGFPLQRCNENNLVKPCKRRVPKKLGAIGERS